MIQGALKLLRRERCDRLWGDPGRRATDRRRDDRRGDGLRKADWPQFGTTLAVVAGSVVALFARPINAWPVAGIALFARVVGYAAGTVWQDRAAVRA